MATDTSADTAHLRAEAEELLFEEASRLDHRDFPGWLELFTEDCIYWIPSMRDELDPSRHVSIVYDDRQLLKERVWRLDSGLAYAQEPGSRSVHVVGNVQVKGAVDGDIHVESAQIVTEFRRGRQHVHAARCTHHLRRERGGLLIALKKILLVNNDGHLGNLSVLL